MKTKKMQIITGHKAISQAIAGFKHKARSIQADMHFLAVSTANHTLTTGDSTLMVRLLEAMPKSTRANKLLFWMEKTTGYKYIAVDDNGKKLDKPVFKKEQNWDDVQKELSLQEGIATPFWKMKQKVDEDVSPQQAMQKIEQIIIAQLAKAMESGNIIDLDKLRDKAAKKANVIRFNGTGVQFYLDHGTTKPELSKVQAQ